jgi:phosphatidylserine/phosphatidylglycerophosphate/cardiolipin synthase-like enzyme
MDGVWRSAQRKVVLTGSQNFTGPALTGNDETMLRIESEAIHARFMADWNAMAAHPLAQ